MGMQILLNIEEGLLDELCPNNAYIDWKARGYKL